MTDMTLEEMKKAKKEKGYTIEMISRQSGVPAGTLQKIFGGATSSPRYDTIKKLNRFFAAHGHSHAGSAFRTARTMIPDTVKDADAAYDAKPQKKKQGEYTLEDYLALPDERRAELIDGVFYDMSAPSYSHQLISGNLYLQLRNYISGKKGECLAFTAPADVQLDGDDRTIVEPDVFVICDRNKIHNARAVGAPDFVIEVLSPSTRKRDITLKAYKYQSAGVREYWMVDPDKRKVITYWFTEGDDAEIGIYGFDDRIPVRIFGGDCLLDFHENRDFLEQLLSEPQV